MLLGTPSLKQRHTYDERKKPWGRKKTIERIEQGALRVDKNLRELHIYSNLRS